MSEDKDSTIVLERVNKNKSSFYSDMSDRIISKLVYQIAHTCNLQCPYCCSDKGLFGKNKPQLMTDPILSYSLELFARLFREIKTIYLFGGEPTINLDAIEIICKKVRALVHNGVLKDLPTIALTTNGLSLTDRFFGLMRDYQIKVGVSMDGPPSIHDKMRIDSKGQGTFYKIVENIKEMKRKTGQSPIISITYTPLHLGSNMKLWDILQALRDETGVSFFSVTPSFDTNYSKGFDPLTYNARKVIEEMEDVVTKSVISMSSSADPIIMSHIPIFAEQFVGKDGHQLNFCPAGRTYFSLAYDGNVYPCQNLPEDENMKIGNIYDDDIETKLTRSAVGMKLNHANIVAMKQLKGSWQDRCIKICPAYNLSETDTTHTLAPNRKSMYLSMAQAFGKAMIEVLADERKFHQFMGNLSRSTETEED